MRPLHVNCFQINNSWEWINNGIFIFVFSTPIRDNNINSNSDSDSDLLLKQVKSLVLQDMAADTEPKKIIIDTDPGIGNVIF